MTDELKPCPFCGNKYPAIGYDSDMKALNRENCVTARCRQCGAETRKFPNASDAASSWNTRSTPKVKPLVWRQWGNEWDANNPVGENFTVKIDGHSGFYLFCGDHTKATDFIEAVRDRSTPEDCMRQAFLVVEHRILNALDWSFSNDD